MRLFYFLCVLLITSCVGQDGSDRSSQSASEKESTDINRIDTSGQKPILAKPINYENDRFKNVVVKKLASDTYQLTGEGQIFEASFNWVIEDGHNELKSGYSVTDAGAPAWGKFDFTINVAKQRDNSVLHIILFEASAEDGRRTHELVIPLP